MARAGLTAAMESASLARVVTPIFLVDIQTTSGISRFWTGYGNLVWNANTFKGQGEFLGVDKIEETTDLKASGIVLSLSGIPASLVSMVLNEIRQGFPANVWLGALSSSGTLIIDPVLLFSGLTDVPEMEEGGDTATITLTVESLEIDRQRSRVRRYTPEDQRRIDPDDIGFEYVAGLQDADIVWGN